VVTSARVARAEAHATSTRDAGDNKGGWWAGAAPAEARVTSNRDAGDNKGRAWWSSCAARGHHDPALRGLRENDPRCVMRLSEGGGGACAPACVIECDTHFETRNFRCCAEFVAPQCGSYGLLANWCQAMWESAPQPRACLRLGVMQAMLSEVAS